MKCQVKAIINFNDLQENKKRVIGDVFECSEERANFLVEHNAVEIVAEVSEEVVQAVATAIVEEAEEQGKEVNEVVNEIVEESKEETLNELGNPVGTREIEEKQKTTKNKKSSKK